MYKVSWGKPIKSSDRFFARPNGAVIYPDTLTHVFKKYAERAGLKDFHLHGLRHTQISLLIEAGASMLSSSRQAGHSDVGFTNNVYGKLIPGTERGTSEKLNHGLKGVLVNDG